MERDETWGEGGELEQPKCQAENHHTPVSGQKGFHLWSEVKGQQKQDFQEVSS